MKPGVKSLLVLFLATITYHSNAQKTQIHTVEEAIKIGLTNNGEVEAGKLRTKASEALEKTASELPKLNINTQLGQYSSEAFDNAFQVSQTIPFPGVFSANKSLLKAQSDANRTKQKIAENDLKKTIRIYFYQIRYLQHNQTQLNYMDSLYQDFIRIAELRYKTGDTKKLDITNTRAQKGEIELLVKQNSAQLSTAYLNLQSTLNLDDGIEVPEQHTFQPLQIDQLLDSSDLRQHPLVKALYQESLVAMQTSKVEKAKNGPDFTLGYTNQSLIGFQNIAGQERYMGGDQRFNYMSLGIALPLSIGAGKARVKASRYEADATQAEARQKEVELETSLKNAYNQYHQDILSYNYYKEQALPNATAMVEAARSGYRLGEIGYVEVLYSLEKATNIRLNYLKSIQRLNASVIQVYYLTNQ